MRKVMMKMMEKKKRTRKIRKNPRTKRN